MKKIITTFLCFSIVFGLRAQSLTPQVIASAGGYQSSPVGSLSFTIGESNTQSLTSATHMLTQGFQQPYKLTLNLKAFLQGYYVGSGLMANVLYNQGVTVNPGNETDSIRIELRASASPFPLISSGIKVIQTDGTVTLSGLASVGLSCYIVIKSRNCVETWSANPVLLTENTLYDFSTVANKAYGDNQVEAEPGNFAFYTGDINQDGVVDGLDYNDWENDSNNFAGGYFGTDLNGDGIVDGLDFIYWEQNSNNFVGAVVP